MKNGSKTGLMLLIAGSMVSFSSSALCGETEWWVVDTAAEMLAGEGNGVSVHSDGTLQAVTRWRATADLEEPVALAADRLPGGDLVVATGHPARLYRLRGGSKELLADLPGEQATAVLADDEGSVWVATMAPGILLRWQKGELEEIGRLGEGAFWALAEFDGRIVAAAGPPGALFRVGDRGLQRWLEVPDDFIRSMVRLKDRLILGTSGKGLVISVDKRGRSALLVDSAFTEISALAVDSAGELWATALVGEPAAPARAGGAGSTAGGEAKSETVTTTLDLDLPKVNGKSATSELVRITPEGGSLHVHRFPKQVATALAPDGEGVLVGTGYEGEVWRFLAEGGAREASIDAVQVTAFARDGSAFLTQGPASVFTRSRKPEQEAFFRGPSKAFSLPVRFGRYRILPVGVEGVAIRFRTGGISDDDPMWLGWTEWTDLSNGLVDIPFGRALQWDLRLAPGRVVEGVEISYREINLAPVVEKTLVEEPGVIYLSGPPPPGAVIRQDHPTFEGVFTTLGDNGRSANGAAKKGKKVYQVGFRTVSWSVKDANGDPLIFDLDLERGDGLTLPIRRDFKGQQLAVDVTAAPDGRYRFHLTASDRPANRGDGLSGRGASPWFVVDNSPPVITAAEEGDGWRVTIDDASPLAKVEVSWDGELWRRLEPEDGLLDGAREHFVIERKPEAKFVMVRAFDRHHNRAVKGVEEGL